MDWVWAVSPWSRIALSTPRPVFPILHLLRVPLEAMSDAVESVYLYPAGVAIEFRVASLTREKLLSDVDRGAEILRLSESMG